MILNLVLFYRAAAEKALDWLLSTFDIASADKAVVVAARLLNVDDFEDAG